MLWTNGSQFKFWYGNATTREFSPFSSSLIGSYGGGWEPFGAGDINGDGTADIVFRAGTHIAYWLIIDPPSNGSFPFAESRYGGDGGPGFRPVAISDYDGNGKADILFDNGSQLKLWDFGGASIGFTPRLVGDYGNGWQPLELLIRY